MSYCEYFWLLVDVIHERELLMNQESYLSNINKCINI